MDLEKLAVFRTHACSSIEMMGVRKTMCLDNDLLEVYSLVWILSVYCLHLDRSQSCEVSLIIGESLVAEVYFENNNSQSQNRIQNPSLSAREPVLYVLVSQLVFNYPKVNWLRRLIVDQRVNVDHFLKTTNKTNSWVSDFDNKRIGDNSFALTRLLVNLAMNH